MEMRYRCTKCGTCSPHKDPCFVCGNCKKDPIKRDAGKEKEIQKKKKRKRF